MQPISLSKAAVSLLAFSQLGSSQASRVSSDSPLNQLKPTTSQAAKGLQAHTRHLTDASCAARLEACTDNCADVTTSAFLGSQADAAQSTTDNLDFQTHSQVSANEGVLDQANTPASTAPSPAQTPHGSPAQAENPANTPSAPDYSGVPDYKDCVDACYADIACEYTGESSLAQIAGRSADQSSTAVKQAVTSVAALAAAAAILA